MRLARNPDAMTNTWAVILTMVPTPSARARPKRIKTPWVKRRYAIEIVHGIMRRMPRRAAAWISGGACMRRPTTMSKSGVNAISAWSTVSADEVHSAKRRSSP
jgi:hypothetical protein